MNPVFCLPFLLLSIMTVQSVFLDPSSPYLTYSGRISITPTMATFDWPCTQISLSFQGTFLSVIMNGGNNRFYVLLNGQIFAEIETNDQMQEYQLLQNIDPQVRSNFTLFKKTEASYLIVEILEPFKPVQVKGFSLEGTPIAPTFNSSRRLEFFGDSDSNGYGIDGPDEFFCFLNIPKYENCYFDYVSLLSRSFGADYRVMAWSGKGVVHNAVSFEPESNNPMPVFWNRTIATEPNSLWNFKSWLPNAVVILLGSNDYFNEPYPTDNEFIEGYVKMLSQITSSYEPYEPFIINLCGGLKTFAPCPRVSVASNQFSKNYTKNFYIEFPGSIFTYPEDYGCEDHRNQKGQRILADFLFPKIKAILNW